MLANRRAVMPVLVNGAAMPSDSEIPPSLLPFRYRHAIAVRSGDDFPADIQRLFRSIDALTVKFWTLYVSLYLALPFVLMLLCHYLLLFKFDVDPLYLRIAVGVISAALGIGLCFQVGFRALPALLTGAAVGLTAAIGMLAVSFSLGNPYTPFDIWTFMPSLVRDREEVHRIFRHRRAGDAVQQSRRLAVSRSARSPAGALARRRGVRSPLTQTRERHLESAAEFRYRRRRGPGSMQIGARALASLGIWLAASAASPAFAQSSSSPDKSQYWLLNPVPADQMRDFNTDRPTKANVAIHGRCRSLPIRDRHRQFCHLGKWRRSASTRF